MWPEGTNVRTVADLHGALGALCQYLSISLSSKLLAHCHVFGFQAAKHFIGWRGAVVPSAVFNGLPDFRNL